MTTRSVASPPSAANGLAVAIIPARFASSRFPGKMLADRTGKPLVQHVWERVRQAARIGRVIVATDDRRILDAVERFGGEAVMTGSDHPNGTSRIAAVAATLTEDLIVNVQGDEPEIEPRLIDRVVDLLAERPACPVATLATPIANPADADDPNVVKVVLALDGTAIYFSRSRIPFDRDGTASAPLLRHIGLYGFRRDSLLRFVALPESPLENSERLEQLRALENGIPIAVALVEGGGHGIDTLAQYEAFVRRVASSST